MAVLIIKRYSILLIINEYVGKLHEHCGEIKKHIHIVPKSIPISGHM